MFSGESYQIIPNEGSEHPYEKNSTNILRKRISNILPQKVEPSLIIKEPMNEDETERKRNSQSIQPPPSNIGRQLRNYHLLLKSVLYASIYFI